MNPRSKRNSKPRIILFRENAKRFTHSVTTFLTMRFCLFLLLFCFCFCFLFCLNKHRWCLRPTHLSLRLRFHCPARRLEQCVLPLPPRLSALPISLVSGGSSSPMKGHGYESHPLPIIRRCAGGFRTHIPVTKQYNLVLYSERSATLRG